MPIINPTKCFNNPFNQTIRPQTDIPSDWLDMLRHTWAELLQLNDDNKQQFFNEFTRHCNSDSHYPHKADLLDGLQQFYLCLTNRTERHFTEQEKKMMLLSLSADIDACTPGFHNRVNQTQIFLHIPCSMDRYLFLIRMNLIDKLARSFSSDVHIHNKFFSNAAEKYGVNVPNLHDPYMDSIQNPSNDTINKALELSMNSYYKSFQIIENLYQLLELTLTNHFGYCGPIPDGYTPTAYLGMASYLEKLFELESLNIMDYFVSDDEANILDINWNAVKLAIFNYLKQHQYIEFKEYESTLFLQLFTQTQLPQIEILKFNQIFDNHHELLVFLFLSSQPNFKSKFQLLLDYLCQLSTPTRFAAVHDALNMSESLKYSELVPMLTEINRIVYLPKFLMTEQFKYQNVVLQNIKKNTHFPTTIHLLSLLNVQDYCLFIQWPDDQHYNIVMLAVKHGESVVQRLLEHIKHRAPDAIFYHLLKMSNEINRNSLMLAVESKSLSYRPLLKHIQTLSTDKQETLLTKRDSDGTHILMLALQSSQNCFDELLDFICIQIPSCLPELLMTTNAQGFNLIAFAFSCPKINISILFDKLKQLSYRQKLQILEQNNSHSENLIMQCAQRNAPYFRLLMELLFSLDNLDREDILKKKNLFGNTILDCLVSGRSPDIEYFLNIIQQQHPVLIPHFINNNSAQFSGTLIHMIKHHAQALPIFFQLLNELPLNTQFDILTYTSVELQEGLLIHTVNYAEPSLPLIFDSLLSYYTLGFSDELTEFFVSELMGIISQHQKAKKLLSCLLHCYKSKFYAFIEDVCHHLTFLDILEFNRLSIHLAKIISLFIQDEFSGPKILEFLSHYLLKSYNAADGRVETAIFHLLVGFEDIAVQSLYIPYIKYMFKMGYYLEEPGFKPIFDFVKQQSLSFQKAFLLDADDAGNTTLSAYLMHVDEQILSFFDWIISLDQELQYVVWTQRNLEGKNCLHIIFEQAHYPAIKSILTHLMDKLFMLNDRIKYQLFRILPEYPNTNIVMSAAAHAPSKLPKLLEEVSKYEFFPMVMTHSNPKGYNVFLLSVHQNSSKLDLLIQYIQKLDVSTQFEILNQTCQTEASEHFPDKNIFDILLPQTNSQLNIVIDLIKKFSVEQQMTILGKTHFQQIIGIEGHTLELFKNYKKSVEHASIPNFFSYKRPREEDTTSSKLNYK